MAREAIALQARPITLAALTQQIQTAVEPQGLTAKLSRDGDSLVVDLFGSICPDPLLAMITVEQELGRSAMSDLEAVKLYGHIAQADSAAPADAVAPSSPSWMSVIDLKGYFARRAGLPPEAFGLPRSEASRLACEAERDRTASFPRNSKSPRATAQTNPPMALEADPTAADLAVAPHLETSFTASESKGNTLELEDPWESELPAGTETLAAPQSLEQFPKVAPAQLQSVAQELDQTQMTPPGMTPPGTTPPSYDRYRTFITDRSSWFSQTVKDNPRLHSLAKQRQYQTIGTLSHYLVDNLAENETLMDLVPVRKGDRSYGLIFTDQRVISLSKPNRRNSLRNLRNSRAGLQVWTVPWSWVHKVEISADALRFHYGRARERFRVDLETPYHLRNSIPREIPVRMVREIQSSSQRPLDTKAGLMMVAGVMFALGSGFSFLNLSINRQQIEARSNPLDASRTALQANLPDRAIKRSGETLPASTVAAPLEKTTNHKQCVNNFNHVAQPHAYATLNQVTQTLQVNLQNQSLLQMAQPQFNQTAALVAQEILSSCQAQAIAQVVVTNGVLRYQQQRTAPKAAPIKTESN